MGGAKSASFRLFRNLFVQGYLAARKRDAKIMQLVEMTKTGVGRCATRAGADVAAVCRGTAVARLPSPPPPPSWPPCPWRPSAAVGGRWRACLCPRVCVLVSVSSPSHLA
jgi:hypothetical protein